MTMYCNILAGFYIFDFLKIIIHSSFAAGLYSVAGVYGLGYQLEIIEFLAMASLKILIISISILVLRLLFRDKHSAPYMIMVVCYLIL